MDIAPGLGLFRRLRRWRPRGARTFTHVVPLGLSCRVTYQVRRYFGSAEAYPFDWWISPLGGLTRYLGALDPQRIYNETALREVVRDGRVVSLESIELGIQPYHDFPRYQDCGVSVLSPGWREHLPAAAARHAERLQRLLDLDRPAHRVLFVRHRFDADRTLAASQPDVDALWRVLAAQFSRCEAYLLLVNLGDIHVPERRRSLRLDVDDRPGPAAEEWRGSDASWDAGLRSLGLQPLRDSAGPIRISF